MAFGLSGCFLPTPFSIVSIGADAVSFVFSGKTVTDHGISLALDEDCAMIGVLEGEICDDQPAYRDANVALALAPLPPPNDMEELAEADAQVLASAQRAAAVFGDRAPAGDGVTESALADAGASSKIPAEVRPRRRPDNVVLVASAAQSAVTVPLPTRRPEPQSSLSGGFLIDAAVAPGSQDVLVLQVAMVAPAAGASSDVAPLPGPDAAGEDGVERSPAGVVSKSQAPGPRPAKAQRPRIKRQVVAAATTIERAPVVVPKVSAQQRLSASRTGSEVGRAPTVQVAVEFSPPKDGSVAKRYTRPVSSEMGG